MSPTERRINCTAAEIRAYQAGERTLRRRVKPQPTHFHRDIIGKPRPWKQEDFDRLLPQIDEKEIVSPFGSPGDRLALREAWRDHMPFGCESMMELIEYRATPWPEPITGIEIPKWQPASKMPRWAARYTPTVRAVRVEQVNGEWWWVCEVEG